MKKVFFILSGVFASIGIVIALQNAALTCVYQVFLDQHNGGLVKPILVVFLLGFFSGFPFGLALMMKKSRPEDLDSLNF